MCVCVYMRMCTCAYICIRGCIPTCMCLVSEIHSRYTRTLSLRLRWCFSRQISPLAHRCVREIKSDTWAESTSDTWAESTSDTWAESNSDTWAESNSDKHPLMLLVLKLRSCLVRLKALWIAVIDSPVICQRGQRAETVSSMCTCMSVCLYVCIPCMHVCMSVCQACMHAYIQTCTHTYSDVYPVFNACI
jgi:hypothetical protein